MLSEFTAKNRYGTLTWTPSTEAANGLNAQLQSAQRPVRKGIESMMKKFARILGYVGSRPLADRPGGLALDDAITTTNRCLNECSTQLGIDK